MCVRPYTPHHSAPHDSLASALRLRLREEAKATVLPGYSAFFEKYGAMQFSKKHMDSYLRFPPTTVASMVDELYSG